MCSRPRPGFRSAKSCHPIDSMQGSILDVSAYQVTGTTAENPKREVHRP